MTRSGVLLAAALTLATLPAIAAPKNESMATVKGLSDFCDAPDKTEKAGACNGFIAGIMALEAFQHKKMDTRVAFCPPEETDELVVGITQMLSSLRAAARDARPAVRNTPALIGVIAAGRVAFPCPGEPD